MTKYNSIAVLCFTILHDEEDGSDITGQMLTAAIEKRIENLDSCGDLEWEEACLPVSDTFEENP